MKKKITIALQENHENAPSLRTRIYYPHSSVNVDGLIDEQEQLSELLIQQKEEIEPQLRGLQLKLDNQKEELENQLRELQLKLDNQKENSAIQKEEMEAQLGELQLKLDIQKEDDSIQKQELANQLRELQFKFDIKTQELSEVTDTWKIKSEVFDDQLTELKQYISLLNDELFFIKEKLNQTIVKQRRDS